MNTTAHPRRQPSGPDPDAVARLFETQYALATSTQLRAAGVDAALQRTRIERGEWAEHAPGVVKLCGAPADWRQPVMAVGLSSPRVGVTAGTALRVHAVDGFGDFDDVFAVARLGDKPRLADDVRLWRSRRLEDTDLMIVGGIRTTTLATALVHAAALHDGEALGRAVDDALRRVRPGWLQETAERWRGPGMPGSGVLSAALAERCDQRLPRSWFERLARKALAEHGIEMEHEVPVRDGKRRIAVLDLAIVALKVGVECQSWQWHSTPAARRANARRKRLLARLGWSIIELWWSDLHHPNDVVADIHIEVERQRQLLGVVAL